ncbi:MAG: hypothetical protein WC992_08940, partial [Acholeplasmataceae bacterium]
MYVRNKLRLDSEPRRIFTLPVTNNEPGPFSSYDLGDEITCELNSFGCDGYHNSVRVVGREFFPQTGECLLAVEEFRDPEFWIYEEELEGSAEE